eukprot:414781-Amphidinium_carterae.1
MLPDTRSDVSKHMTAEESLQGAFLVTSGYQNEPDSTAVALEDRECTADQSNHTNWINPHPEYSYGHFAALFLVCTSLPHCGSTSPLGE